MQSSSPPRISDERTTLTGLAPRAVRLLTLAGGTVLALGFVLGCLQRDQLRHFFHSYLASYCFYLSISLGALFFVALQHAVRAGWSVTVRRLAEILAAALPLLSVMFLPIVVPVLLGNHSLYPWVDAAVTGRDELLRSKTFYLNLPFFAVRCVAYFAVWGCFARYFLLRSVQQDVSGDAALTLRMERASLAALVLLGLSVTFAAFDWLMALQPHWYSTIFGVYYFSGTVVGALAAIILAALVLQATGRLRCSITVEHYHDLGKLLFAFVIFWGYIAFSQYLLIWYANVPEETSWYGPRHSGSWGWVSLGLLLGHLVIPFFGLLPREVKRRKGLLGFWAAWLLVVHFVDVYWLVMPSLNPRHAAPAAVDLCCLLGLGGLYLAAVLWVAGDRSLVPLKDPRLAEALAFENT